MRAACRLLEPSILVVVLVSVSVSVSVSVAACGGRGAPAKPPPAASSAPAILAHVPADTPYVLTSFEGFAAPGFERVFAAFERKLAELLRLTETFDAESRRELPPALRSLLALGDEMKGKGGWARALGLAPRPAFVVYGLSVWPVVRVEVADRARLLAVIERALAAGDQPLERRALGGHTYWSRSDGELTVVGAVLERELVLAVLPTAAVHGALPSLLAQPPPARSLASAPGFADLKARHRMLGLMFGFVDLRRAVARLTTATPDALDVALHAMTGTITDACRADLARLADAVPRVVYGYHRADTRGFEASVLVELAPELRRTLAALRTRTPEVRVDPRRRPLLALGVAVDGDEAVRWVRDVAGQLQARPFECEWFRELGPASRALASLVEEPLPPMFRGLRGFSVSVDELEVSPLRVVAHALIADDGNGDPRAWLAWLTSIAVERDGKPVELPAADLPIERLAPVYVAATTDRLVATVGAGAETRITRHLTEPPPERSPLVVLALNGARLAALVQAADDGDGDGDGDGMSASDYEELASWGDVVLTGDLDVTGLAIRASGRWN